jgi:Peptidase family M23
MRHAHRSTILLAALLVAAAARPVAAASDGIAPGTAFSLLAASVPTNPMPVPGSDGQVHLAYELILTNTTSLTIRVDRLDIADEGSDRVLQTLEGETLAAGMTPLGGAPPGASADDATTLAGSAARVVWLDVPVPTPADVPATLGHRVFAAVVRPDGGPGRAFDAPIARVPVQAGAPLVLGPPVGDGVWYLSDGCCGGESHHRRGLAAVNGQLGVPQRYAIDWFMLDDAHRAWAGDPAQLGSYRSYRQPLLAAADGVVVDAQDGLPNSQSLPNPPPVPPIDDTVGNHVTLRVGVGVFLLYGHMDPGSVAVSKGQAVSRGQQLGLIGTSGNSTTPHLHFQVMTTPTFFPTDSPPFVFDHYTLLGQITERIWDDDLGLQPTGVLPFAPAPRAAARANEMPLDRTVIRFEEGAQR